MDRFYIKGSNCPEGPTILRHRKRASCPFHSVLFRNETPLNHSFRLLIRVSIQCYKGHLIEVYRVQRELLYGFRTQNPGKNGMEYSVPLLLAHENQSLTKISAFIRQLPVLHLGSYIQLNVPKHFQSKAVCTCMTNSMSLYQKQHAILFLQDHVAKQRFRFSKFPVTCTCMSTALYLEQSIWKTKLGAKPRLRHK